MRRAHPDFGFSTKLQDYNAGKGPGDLAFKTLLEQAWEAALAQGEKMATTKTERPVYDGHGGYVNKKVLCCKKVTVVFHCADPTARKYAGVYNPTKGQHGYCDRGMRFSVVGGKLKQEEFRVETW